MRVACLGGGPAGLYFAISMKLRDPSHEVVVIDDVPYQVVDVEYWARRLGSSDRRLVWPTVYVVPVRGEEWKQRLERRVPRESEGKPPVRY